MQNLPCKQNLCTKYWRNMNPIQFSRPVMFNPLRPHGLQHTGFPCSTPRTCSLMSIKSMKPSNHLILCRPLLLPSTFPSIKVFSMSQFFSSDGQSIGVSAWPSVLPMNIQDWFPLGLTGWISLQSKGLSRVFSNTTVRKHQFFATQFSYKSDSHIHTWLPGKP